MRPQDWADEQIRRGNRAGRLYRENQGSSNPQDHPAGSGEHYTRVCGGAFPTGRNPRLPNSGTPKG